MKKKMIVMFLVLMLGFGVTAPMRAEGGFLLGAVTGALLFGGDDVTVGSSSSILYTAPRVSERVKDPLKMKMVATDNSSFTKDCYGPCDVVNGKSIEDMFYILVKDGSKYEILQVVRIFSNSSNSAASIWFTYIDKSFMIPLNEFIKEEKKK